MHAVKSHLHWQQKEYYVLRVWLPLPPQKHLYAFVHGAKHYVPDQLSNKQTRHDNDDRF
jgi:hypothetical protein